MRHDHTYAQCSDAPRTRFGLDGITVAALYDLENDKQLQFVDNSQLVAQDGRETRLNFLCEEWFFRVDRTSEIPPAERNS